MLMSTTGTKRLLEQQLAHTQRQLVKRGLVIEKMSIFLEQPLAFGREDGDVTLELCRPKPGLFERRPELYRLPGQFGQFPAERKTIEIGCQQRPQCLSSGRQIVVGGGRFEPEAFVNGVDIAGHGGECRDARRIARIDLQFYASALDRAGWRE